MQILPTAAVTHNRGLTLTQPRAQAASNNGTSGTNGTGSSNASSPNSVSSLTSEQTFLQLLIAQIQNQDPLNPTDSIQFVGQLTQYSELEQLIGINQGVQTLTGAPPPTSGTNGSSNNGTNSGTNGTTKS